MNDPFASVNKFLDSVNKRPYNPEEEKEKNRIPLSLVPDLNATLNAKPQKRIVPQESREEITEYLQQKPEENTPRTSLGVDYTLDDLEKNPEFQTVAGRFLESVQSNDNIYEYLRDTDWSLTSAIARSLEIDEWSEQAKQDYNYLRQTFDSASVGGLKQKLNLFKNATVDIFTDPIELVAMAAIPFTGGASQGTKQLVKIALKEGLKKNQKAKLTKSVLKDAKKPALFTALEGGAWGGSHNYFLQKSDVELGIREQLDATEIGLTAALAASMGGALGGSVGLLRSTSPLLAKKLRLYSNEDEINKRVGAKGKTPKEQSKTLNDEYEAGSETNKLLPNFLKFISATVGKPTTYLLKAGKTVTEIGKQLDLYKYDWYKTTTNAVREGLDKLSFGEVLVPMRSNWLADFGTAINKIERTGKSKKWGFNTFWNNRMNDRENAQLYYLLTNRKKKQQRTKTMPYGKYKGSKIKQSTRTAANKIGLILDDIHREAQRKGEFNGVEYDQLLSSEAFLENYFPHRIQAELLKKDPEGFKNLLQMYGKTVDGEVVPYAKPNNSFSSSSIEEVVDEFGNVIKGPKPKGITVDYEAFQRDFIKDATEELGEGATQKEIDKLAMDMKADKIYEDMLRMSEDPLWNLKLQDEAIAKTQGTRVSGKTGWLKERVFSDIPAEDMYRYIDNDVERVMNDYITNTSMLIARERVFGRNLSVYATRHLNPMIKAMKRDGVDKAEQDAIIDRFKIMYQKIAGVETPTPFGTGHTRTFMAGMKAMQTFAHLPLATVSSLTEPLIMLSRVQKENIPNAAYNFGSAIVKESKKFGERFNNGIKRQFGIKHTGTKDFVDESWLEVYKVGLAMEQALMDRLDGMYGDLQGSQGLQKLTRGFFKTTLLTQWTAAVQLAAFTTGKRLILENTQRLATGKSLWGNKLSKGAMERYRNELRHLNVDEKKAIKWYNSSLDENGKFDMVRGKRKKGFYENDYVMGANRFSREIILIPDVTEANKPLWYSHPVGQMFAQFASYPTAFNNTILKRFAYETTEDFKGLPKGRIPVATPKIVATAAMMTFMATITNAGRSQGRSLEKSDDEILADSIDRWGGLGPLQYPYRFMQNAEYGSGPIGSVAKAGSGPLIQDILDSLLYRKGLAENIASNVPFQSLIRTLDPDAAKALQDEGKKIDKILFSPFAASKKPKTVTKSKALYKSAYAPTRLYAKGGIVNDVEQVKNEPDERVDRMTGLPYHMQAGILGQDEEDRAAFAEGGPVNPEHSDVYSLITKDIRNLAPIYRDDEPISEYTEKELKGYAKGIDKPLYRAIKKDTAQQDAEDFRDSQKIGVHLDTEVPEKGDLILKGFIELNRPLDLSEMDVPLEGFLFVEEIKNNKELKNKIVDDSILPPPTVEEHIEDLLFHHSLKKEAIKDHKSLPNLKSILNITASHKVREVLKDIGYDGIIYEEDTGREQKFAGGFFSKLARKAKKKKVVALDKNQYRVTRKAKQEELLDDEILRKRMEEDFRTLYVYADNETRGAIKDIRGSSANRARGLTNSVGIRTKKDPSTKGSSYYNDYKDSNNRYLNSKQIKQRVMNINSDMANVLREFVSGDYTKIKFSQELLDGVDFRQAKSSFTERNFREKLKMVKEFAEKDAKNKLSAFEMGATQEGRLESLEQTIGSMLYGPRWKRTETQFIKNEEGVVTDMVQRSPIIDPSYKTKAQKSKVSIEVTDRPRDATASDLGVPEDQALYAKGHKESIKRERALDPIPTKFEEFKVYIKELEESNSPYKIELAEELKLDWMKDNPDLPFPDDWIPKIIGGE